MLSDVSVNEPQHNVFSYIPRGFSLVGREILSVNVGTWDLAVFEGESVLGDRTVGVEVESHGGADALEAALAAQPHVRAVALCHGEVV